MNISSIHLSLLFIHIHSDYSRIVGFINVIDIESLAVSSMLEGILYESNYCYFQARSSSSRTKAIQEKFLVTVKTLENTDYKMVGLAKPAESLTCPPLCEAWRSLRLWSTVTVSHWFFKFLPHCTSSSADSPHTYRKQSTIDVSLPYPLPIGYTEP